MLIVNIHDLTVARKQGKIVLQAYLFANAEKNVTTVCQNNLFIFWVCTMDNSLKYN